MILINKMIFLLMLIFSTIISISSNSWLSMWIGLEINTLCFIPLLTQKNNSFSSESSMKYFLIQVFSSSIFLFSILMFLNFSFFKNMIINNYIMLILNFSLMLKMGMAPFHFWFPEIMEKMNWMNSLILLTWQKIAPMIILYYSMSPTISMYMIIIIMISTYIGSIGGLNQTNLQKIISYSSINHMGWMLGSLMINLMIWNIYFIIYSIISITLIIPLNFFKIYFLKQIYTLKNNSNKMIIFLNLFSLGGLPPFLGFYPKWLMIQYYINFNYMIVMFMISMTLITLFFYMRMMYSSLLLTNNNLFCLNFLIKSKLNLTMFFFISLNLFGLILITLFMNL